LVLPFCCLHSAFYSVSLKIFLHHLLDFIPLDSQILYTRNSLFSTGPAPTCVSLYYTMSTGWYAPRARYNGIDSRPHATGIVGSGIHNTCPCPSLHPTEAVSGPLPGARLRPDTRKARRGVKRVIPTRQRAGASLLPIKQFFQPFQLGYATGDCFMDFYPLPKLLQGLGALGQGI